MCAGTYIPFSLSAPSHLPWFHQGGRHQHDRRRPRVRQHPQRRLSPPEARRHQPPAVHVGWRKPGAHADAAQKPLPDVEGVVTVVRQQKRVIQAVPAVSGTAVGPRARTGIWLSSGRGGKGILKRSPWDSVVRRVASPQTPSVASVLANRRSIVRLVCARRRYHRPPLNTAVLRQVFKFKPNKIEPSVGVLNVSH